MKGAAARRALVVFARAPEPGRSKTRLVPAVGASGAAALHAAFLDDTCATCARVAATRLLAATGDLAHPRLVAAAARTGMRLVAQEGADLGARMAAALLACLDGRLARAEAACVVGSDAPTITADMIDRAFALLDGSDLVLGPADDGGYWIVGARRRVLDERDRFAAVFLDTAWGTAGVRETTERRAHERAFTVAHADPHWDVDEPADLARLARALDGDPGLAPSTRALLSASPPA